MRFPLKQWELHGPHPEKVCEHFLLKSQMSYEHLQRGNLELIFQLTITLGAIEEEKILLRYGIKYMRSNEASGYPCL